MKKISQIETGGRFLYGGIEWVKTTRTIGVLLPYAAN